MAPCAVGLRGWCVAVSVGLGASLRTSEPSADPSHPDRIPSGKFREYHVPEDMPKTAEVGRHGRRWTPNGWVQKRQAGHRAYFDFHIPKTAGCSFSLDVLKVLPEDEGYFSLEACYYRSPQNESGAQDVKVAFMRNPTSHVYSQFMECKYDPVWNVVPKEDMPKLHSVTSWLRYFDGGRQRYDMRCYHPYNMQTRAFVCRRPDCHHHHQNEAEPNVTLALENLDSLFFVGITEHYQASVCLFFAKTHAGQPLPRFCNCRDKAAWGSFKPTQETHGIPRHSNSDLSEEDLGMISELTRLDAQLYERATARFAREAAEVERSTGTKILCEG